VEYANARTHSSSAAAATARPGSVKSAASVKGRVASAPLPRRTARIPTADSAPLSRRLPRLACPGQRPHLSRSNNSEIGSFTRNKLLPPLASLSGFPPPSLRLRALCPRFPLPLPAFSPPSPRSFSPCFIMAMDQSSIEKKKWFGGMQALRACVASTNPVKVGAVQKALVACFPDRAVEVEGRDVPSGVADQPMGDEETRRGAMNRLPARESTLIVRGAAALACPLAAFYRSLKVASASSGNPRSD
jgi:hypothetical protein